MYRQSINIAIRQTTVSTYAWVVEKSIQGKDRTLWKSLDLKARFGIRIGHNVKLTVN